MPEAVQVQGARQLRSTMRKAGADMTQLNDTHRAVSGYVAAQGQVRAPKRTGRLAGSVRGSAARTAATVRAGGARVPYAGVIHYGWERRNIRPQPFLTDAAHDTEPVWLHMYYQKVKQILGTVKGI